MGDKGDQGKGEGKGEDLGRAGKGRKKGKDPWSGEKGSDPWSEKDGGDGGGGGNGGGGGGGGGPPPSLQDIAKLFRGEMDPIKHSIQNLESQMQNLNLKVDEQIQSLYDKIQLQDVRVKIGGNCIVRKYVHSK